MNELILHVGMHKTGTSSIQKTLYQNRKNLNKKGFYYPKKWSENHSIEVYSAFCDNPLSYHMNIKKGLDESSIIEHNTNIKNSIIDEVNKIENKKIIISGEDISILNIENIKALKSFIEEELKIKKIKILFSTREAISFYTSNTQETIKGGLPLRKHTKGQKNKIYRDRLEKFISVFGKENIIVYKFEDTFKSIYGPVGYFLEQIGLEKDDIEEIEIHKSNEGISDKAIDLIKFINSEVPLFVNNKINSNRSVSDTNAFYLFSGEKFTLSFEEQSIINNNTKDDVLWLKDTFGIDYPLNIENNYQNLKFDLTYYNEMISIYRELTPLIKSLVYKYILEKMSNFSDKESLICLNNLLSYIINNELSNIEITNKEKDEDFDLQKAYQLKYNVFRDIETLKHIAFTLEKEDKIDFAYYFMKKALELRPNGPIIKEKILDYEQKLNIK